MNNIFRKGSNNEKTKEKKQFDEVPHIYIISNKEIPENSRQKNPDRIGCIAIGIAGKLLN